MAETPRGQNLNAKQPKPENLVVIVLRTDEARWISFMFAGCKFAAKG